MFVVPVTWEAEVGGSQFEVAGQKHETLSKKKYCSWTLGLAFTYVFFALVKIQPLKDFL
jgi:hypothetical protein